MNFGFELAIYVEVDTGDAIHDVALAEGGTVRAKFAVRFNMAVLGSLLEFHAEENGENENEQTLNVDL